MLEDLPTPCIVIDAEIVRRNLAKMSGYAKAHGLAVRPHTKTHKSLKVARMQIEYGAVGLTVAKAGEARVMAGASDDLFMAYPAVDRRRARDLAELARSKRMAVGIDSAYAAAAVAESARSAASVVSVLVDLDVGHHRTGAQSPADALELAQLIDKTPGLRLGGIMFFPGHASLAPDAMSADLAAAAARLQETIDLWRRSGLEAKVVSGGSSPTAYRSHEIPQMTEIRPGTYVYNDMNSVHGGSATLDECAARIAATVVSDAVAGQVVLDAGSKTLTSDRCGPAPESGYGRVVERPEARIVRLFEEHALVDITACREPLRVGQRVSIIPNHICPCINLQDSVWWVEPGEAPRTIPVEARGKVV